MSLGPGTRLGPYEIQSALGAGGMGEVYRARDTRLKRDVALKILPKSFASNPDWSELRHLAGRSTVPDRQAGERVERPAAAACRRAALRRRAEAPRTDEVATALP